MLTQIQSEPMRHLDVFTILQSEHMKYFLIGFSVGLIISFGVDGWFILWNIAREIIRDYFHKTNK